ncbi:CPBP family intramembrane metalloprotease [Ruminococcaceae bacterium OttesenSCG-928-D13]|nr:CPBP family intramembrane metalloprotease [Ruminococcaceae bacterium OttesenSCG-928-D13]
MQTQPILLTREQVKSHFSRLGLGFFAMLAVSQLVGTALSVIVSMVAPALTQTGWFLWVASYLPLYGLGFPVFLAITKGVPDTRANAGILEHRAIGIPGLLMLVAIGMGIVYPLNVFALMLSNLVQQLTGVGITNTLETVVMSSDPFVNLFFAVIVAPVMEEIIFRGMLYRKLAGFGGKMYVFFSAFMFALYHVNVYQLAYAFVLGLVFAALTWFTGTIKYSLFLHIALNLLGSGISPFLYAYASETAVYIYSYCLLGLVVLGIILGVVWVIRHHREIFFAPGFLMMEKKSDTVVNPGVMLMLFLFAALMLMTLLAPYITNLLGLGG